tara:strand:+ start:386 stop:649 length:264 start_codon:yes stop_codon:yes gene_type:complete
MYITIFGYLAGIFGVIPMLPQLIQTYKSKSSKDISLYFLMLNILSSILWIIYGYLRYDLPIIICSSLFGILHIFLLFMKIIFDTTDE